MRVDTDDFARPCSCGREHHIEVKEIIIEAGAVEKLEVMLDDGMLREYISPVIICDTNTFAATEEIMENIYDRCEVIILDAEGLQADQRAVEVAFQNMDDEMDLILAELELSMTSADILLMNMEFLLFQYPLQQVWTDSSAPWRR